jgi:hypothetical protein
LPIQKKSLVATLGKAPETKASAPLSKAILRPHKHQSMKKAASFFSASDKN